MKFGRTYLATIQVGERVGTKVPSVVVRYPLTMEFDVVRNTLASSNTGHFRFFNLKPDTRAQLFHDRNSTTVFRHIVVQAGYESESPLPIIFRGNIIQASSYRAGVNWITEIEAFDGGDAILNGTVSTTAPAGTPIQNLLKTLIASMPNVALGAVSEFQEPNSRAITLDGNSWQIASGIAADNRALAFVDNERANVIKNSEYIPGIESIALISSATGLLQTPRRFDALLEADILFEPRLAIGQHVQLESLETVYNGEYVVMGIHHAGVISGAVGGSATTKVSFNLGAFTLTAAPVSR